MGVVWLSGGQSEQAEEPLVQTKVVIALLDRRKGAVGIAWVMSMED